MDPVEFFRTSGTAQKMLEVEFRFDDDDKASVINAACTKIIRYRGVIRHQRAFSLKVLRHEAIRTAKSNTKHKMCRLEGLDPVAPSVPVSLDSWPERVKDTLGFRPKDRHCKLLEELCVNGKDYEDLGPEIAPSPAAARKMVSEIRKRALALRSRLKRAM